MWWGSVSVLYAIFTLLLDYLNSSVKNIGINCSPNICTKNTHWKFYFNVNKYNRYDPN